MVSDMKIRKNQLIEFSELSTIGNFSITLDRLIEDTRSINHLIPKTVCMLSSLKQLLDDEIKEVTPKLIEIENE